MGDQFGQIAGRLSRLEDNINRLMAQQTGFATSGAAFPTDNLFDGREFFRTDRRLTYSYDLTNTRWLSQLFAGPVVVNEVKNLAQGQHFFDLAFPGFDTNGVLIVAMEAGFVPATQAQSVANYYNITGNMITTTGGLSALTGGVNTQAATVLGNWQRIPWSINQAFANTLFQLEIKIAVGAGNPGTFQFTPSVSYRLIG